MNIEAIVSSRYRMPLGSYRFHKCFDIYATTNRSSKMAQKPLFCLFTPIFVYFPVGVFGIPSVFRNSPKNTKNKYFEPKIPFAQILSQTCSSSSFCFAIFRSTIRLSYPIFYLLNTRQGYFNLILSITRIVITIGHWVYPVHFLISSSSIS
jgi:hypothetical protein